MLKSTKYSLLGLVVVLLTAAHYEDKTEVIMTKTVQRLINSLSPKQKNLAALNFNSTHRMNWHYFPDNAYSDVFGVHRSGVSYKNMTPIQRRLADAVLGASLSHTGFAKAMLVISLEEILRVIEKDTTGLRDLEKYYFSVFGTPSSTSTWGLRVEGHHLSLNFTIKKGRLISSSPTFFGGNPHHVLSGPYKGLRALAKEEDLARTLVKSFDTNQLDRALVSKIAYPEILTRADKRAKLEGHPTGLPASQMDEQQWELLVALVREYAHNMPTETANKRLEKLSTVPRKEILFAWAGSLKAGKGDYYRVQGPSFIIEYDNTQNGNNHSHSVWRDFEGDFGLDVLALHYQQDSHGLKTVSYAYDQEIK